ncbi:MAG: lectin-like protein [Phormidesmis sp.]
MFFNNSDSSANLGETSNAIDSATKVVDYSLPFADTSTSQHEALSPVEADGIEQVMANLEASSIVLSQEAANSASSASLMRDSLTEAAGYQYNGSTYFLTERAVTWEEAQADALLLGGNLVTINDAAEDKWLTETFGANGAYWMGLSDSAEEGVFRWASGEAVTYTNWAAGEPDDFQGTQDYGRINYTDSLQWNDEHVYKTLQGIIEVSVSAAPVAGGDDGANSDDERAEDGITYNGSRYVLLDDSLTWEAAQAQAQQLGGNLVTINNAEEEQWLNETFGNEKLWIGISDKDQEGVFTWASGEAVTYLNWAAGEPNDWQGTQDFGLMNFGGVRQWDDEHFYTELKGVVEIKLNGEGGDEDGGADPTIIDPPVTPETETPTIEIPEGAIAYNGSQYLRIEESLTWEAAQAQAQQLGGNLVTINNAEEEQWLKETFGDEKLWIGISDKDQEGVFTWASGEAVDYLNWAAGEPNDWQGTQDFGLMNFGGDRQWDDEHFYTELKGIVEIKLNGEGSDENPTITDPPVTPEPETPTDEAPTDSFTYNGSQYQLIEETLTWDVAQAQAQQLGGNLVTINSAEEEQWLKETFGQDQKRWIGISDRDQEGVFTWASGEAVTYTNWAPGEPNDWQGTQDFGLMNFGGNRQWDDEHFYTELTGIVEIKLDGSDVAQPEAPVPDVSEPEVPNVVIPPAPLEEGESPVYSIYDDAFTRSVPDDYSGYNANAVEISDWGNIELVTALANAVEEIGGQTLRIPGGDTANYWDWDIGGVVQWTNESGEARPTWTYPYFLPESLPLALNWEYGTTGSIENMKQLFTESGASPLWVVNMNTSDLGKEMRHLQEAIAAGYDIDRIELGNELYFGIQNYVRPDYGAPAPQVGGTPTARDYAAQAKEWALAIRSIPGLEDATIAVTGVSPEHVPERRGVEWWPALLEKTGPDNLSAVDVVDAFTLHPYYSTNDLGVTKGDVGNWNRAGEIARQGIAYLRDTLEDPALHNEALKDKELWITEHNIIEDAVVVLGGTWLQALMLDIHTQEFLKDTRVTSSYAHLLTGNPQWQGITDEYGLQIDGSQRGIADRPFITDSEDAFEPTAMGLVLGKTADVFDEGTATLLKSGEAFIAWQVENSNDKNISAVNANNQSDTLILPEGETWEITMYQANPWDTVYGEEALQIRVQTLNGGDTLTIDAFTKVIATAK